MKAAEELGIRNGTLRNKLRGETAFTLEEAIQIKELVGYDGPLEALFERRKPNEKP